MSEITINKNNKSIVFIHNDITFSQFGIADEILDLITDLQNQLQQKENIIKEVRERLLNEGKPLPSPRELLEILDKGE